MELRPFRGIHYHPAHFENLFALLARPTMSSPSRSATCTTSGTPIMSYA